MPQELLLLIAGASISIVSSILTLIVGNIFQRENDERKRKWELEDKKTSKRIEIEDARITDAREYYGTYLDIVKSLSAVQIDMITNWNITNSNAIYNGSLAKINELVFNSIKKLGSINALGDKELKGAVEELREVCYQEIKNTGEIQNKIGSKDKADLEIILQRAKEFGPKVGSVLGVVAARIESLVGTDI